MFGRRALLARIYRLKLLALGAVMVLVGLGVEFLASRASVASLNNLLAAVLQSLSDALVVTGGLGMTIDFFTGRDRDEADAERTRAVLRELTPDFTDAVLKGFAVRREDLRRVASPELLDTIATNAPSRFASAMSASHRRDRTKPRRLRSATTGAA